MDFEISVKGDIDRVEKSLTRLQRREVPKAASHALNRAAKKGRTVSTRTIAKQANIRPQRKVRDRIVVKRATWHRLGASIRALPRVFNLIEFVVPSKRKPGAFDTKRGVEAKAWGTKKRYPGTFIARGRGSGKPLVFVRTSSKRYPIRPVYGPSIPHEFVRRTTERAIRDAVRASFRKDFLRDLRRRINRMR